jgi:hypothetical protein
MNQCKRLSDCPADRLAQCRGEPVPPAGDVEVQRYKVNVHVGARTMQRQVVLAKDFDTIVTRLTAERDGLLAKLETADKAYKVVSDTALQLFEDSQRLKSELTKARELLARDAGVEGITRYSQLRKEIKSYLATSIAHNLDESCGQDAEAAKGESNE